MVISPCPVVEPFNEHTQPQGRATLILLLNSISVLEEIKDAFGEASNQKDLVFLLLFPK